MSEYLEATLKNHRWWIILPFTLFVALPLVILQVTARLIGFMARSVDQGIEELAGELNTPIHNWWKEEADRRQEAARARQDP